MSRRGAAAVVVLSLVAPLAACGADDDAEIDGAPSTTTESNSVAAENAAPATIPPGIVAAVPFQNRVDVAKGIFQLKIHNGTDRPLAVADVQLVWEGLTTAVSARSNVVAPGGRIDFPVPTVEAHCAGDGTAASMPDVASAVVRIGLADGSRIDVPVFDVKRFAQRLYLDDCERQRLEQAVSIEWVDLHEALLDGRPVTEGMLRLVRRGATETITVERVGNTINFTVEPIGGAALPVLAAGEASVAVAMRFVEARCDAHALSESSQPFRFVVVVDLGDGEERAYTAPPPVDVRVPMRRRAEEACARRGPIDFVGEGDAAAVSGG